MGQVGQLKLIISEQDSIVNSDLVYHAIEILPIIAASSSSNTNFKPQAGRKDAGPRRPPAEFNKQTRTT